MTAMATSRISFRHWPPASARPSGESDAMPWRAGSPSNGCQPRYHGSALGRLLRVLHGYGLAQMGAPLSQPTLLLLVGERMATGFCFHGQRTDAISPALSTSSATSASMAAIGAASRIIPFCISRSAITRPSSSIHPWSRRVEAGSGEHKLARGYRPVITSSAHDIADPSLRRAVQAYLDQERHYVSEAADELRRVSVSGMG